MKIFTNKAFREEVEKTLAKREHERYLAERFERLEQHCYKLESRIQILELEHGKHEDIPVCDVSSIPGR